MLDFNSLPIPGGVLVAGIAWAGISAFAFGPLVADRTIGNSGWPKMCQTKLLSTIAEQTPRTYAKPRIGCRDVMKIFGNGADQLCGEGGDALFKLLEIDPLAGQKEQLRRRKAQRLARIAALAPSRCSCAAAVVGADRLMWGLYAGSARLIGGPKNLQSKLTQALHGPACSKLAEVK